MQSRLSRRTGPWDVGSLALEGMSPEEGASHSPAGPVGRRSSEPEGSGLAEGGGVRGGAGR